MAGWERQAESTVVLQSNVSVEAPRFTVFTPVYNRRDTLHRPFDSLQSQTLQDFEWIVVDDGSTDNPMPVLEDFARRAKFSMQVFSQLNQGKHIAWNYASKIARGELCVQLDSDDACVPETLETFSRIWDSIPLPERGKFSGINVLCRDPETHQSIGDLFPESPLDTNNLDLALVYEITGEHWGCVRLDLLRAYPFPDTDVSTCIPEDVVWFRLARNYKVRCVNVALREYFRDQDNALTRRHLGNRNLYGDWYWNTSLLFEHWPSLLPRPKLLLSTAINSWRYKRHAQVSLTNWKKLFGWRFLLIMPFIPFGELLYQRDRTFTN